MVIEFNKGRGKYQIWFIKVYVHYYAWLFSLCQRVDIFTQNMHDVLYQLDDGVYSSLLKWKKRMSISQGIFFYETFSPYACGASKL